MRLARHSALELIGTGAWPPTTIRGRYVDPLLRGEMAPPRQEYAADLEAVRGTWAKLTPERRALARAAVAIRLDARAGKALVRRREAQTRRRRAVVPDQEILDNPYRIVGDATSGYSRLAGESRSALSIAASSRTTSIAAKCPVPERRELARPATAAACGRDRRQSSDAPPMTATASCRGVEVLERIDRLDLARPCVVPLDWFPGNEDFLKGVVRAARRRDAGDAAAHVVVQALQLEAPRRHGGRDLLGAC